VMDACHALAETLRLEKKFHGDALRVHVDARDIQGGVKKWEWIKKGVPIRIEIGPRDIETRKVCVQRRNRGSSEKEFMDKEEFIQQAPDILQDIHNTLLERATAFRDANIVSCDSIDTFHAHWGQDNPGWLITPWAGTPDEEDELSKQHKVTIRCLPLDKQDEAEAPCILTGRPTRSRAIWGRSY
jgi:prolyl-tRNA synthetase